MSILELEYHDHIHNLHVNSTKFGALNLLVGNSGVGKTQVLRAIGRVRDAATRGTYHAIGCSWKIKVQADGHCYDWSASTASPIGSNGEWSRLVEEHIIRDEENIVSRTPQAFVFNRATLPKLTSADSAISLLRDEEAISPLYDFMLRVRKSESAEVELKGEEYVDPPPTLSEMQGRKVTTRGLVKIENVDMIRDNNDPILEKAFALQANFPDSFAAIIRTYIEIFPTVSDVRVEMVGFFDQGQSVTRDEEMLTVGIKETSSGNWIYGEAISSGMWRTLVHVFELELSPADTVILIDEVENSLGVNCLGAVIDGIRERSRDIQFIMTSHHPYIINNIPIDDWHVVTRRGSTVTVKAASEVPALSGRSSVDKFIRLINAPEFEEGVQ